MSLLPEDTVPAADDAIPGAAPEVGTPAESAQAPAALPVPATPEGDEPQPGTLEFKRIEDAQSAMHRATERAAELERELAALRQPQAPAQPAAPAQAPIDYEALRPLAEELIEAGYEPERAWRLAHREYQMQEALVAKHLAPIAQRADMALGMGAQGTYEASAATAIQDLGLAGMTPAEVATAVRQQVTPQQWAALPEAARQEASQYVAFTLSRRKGTVAPNPGTPPPATPAPNVGVPQGSGAAPAMRQDVADLATFYERTMGLTKAQAAKRAERVAAMPVELEPWEQEAAE